MEFGGDRGHRTFHNTESYTTADLQTGTMTSGYLSVRGPLLDGVRWQARGGLLHDDARDESQSYLQRGFELFVSYDLNLDLLGATQRITLSPFVGINWTDYREANPLVDPDVKRQDRERFVGLAVDAQAVQELRSGSPRAVLEHQLHLPNFRTDNLSVSAGPTFRF